MALGNRELMEKADLVVADLAAGGSLAPAQASRFILTLIDYSVLLPNATVVPMRAPTQRIEKLRFATRVLRAATEGVALSVLERAKPDLDKEELNAQLFKAEVRLNNEVLEDSIERQALRETIIERLAGRIALDMDEILANGDTTSTDAFLAKFDGVLKAANTNTVDAGRAALSRATLRKMLTTMPQEFLRNKLAMRFFMPLDTEIEYRDSLAGRETIRGDAHNEADTTLTYQGTPMLGVPVFPLTLGPGDEHNALLTDPKNINVGIWRTMTLETQKDVPSGTLIVCMSLRFDFKYAEKRATVKTTRLLAAA